MKQDAGIRIQSRLAHGLLLLLSVVALQIGGLSAADALTCSDVFREQPVSALSAAELRGEFTEDERLSALEKLSAQIEERSRRAGPRGLIPFQFERFREAQEKYTEEVTRQLEEPGRSWPSSLKVETVEDILAFFEAHSRIGGEARLGLAEWFLELSEKAKVDRRSARRFNRLVRKVRNFVSRGGLMRGDAEKLLRIIYWERVIQVAPEGEGRGPLRRFSEESIESLIQQRMEFQVFKEGVIRGLDDFGYIKKHFGTRIKEKIRNSNSLRWSNAWVRWLWGVGMDLVFINPANTQYSFLRTAIEGIDPEIMRRFQLEGWDAVKDDLPPHLTRTARIDGRYEWGYSVVGRAMLIGILGIYLPYALYELNEVALQLDEIRIGFLEFEVNHRIFGDPRVLFQSDFQGVNVMGQINEFLSGSIESCLGFSEGGIRGYSPIDALAAVCNRQEIHQILEQLYMQYTQWIEPKNPAFHELAKTYMNFELEKLCGGGAAAGASPFAGCTIFEMKQIIYDSMVRLMRMTPFDRKDLLEVFKEIGL